MISIVGRFLEHSRIYYFHNLGHSDLYMGSADMMPRNIDRRVEVMFPIESPQMREEIVENILKVHLQDTAQGRWLQANGAYIAAATLQEQETPLFNSQLYLLNRRAAA